jgi:tetratricopeptide (TPR) repeat protein
VFDPDAALQALERGESVLVEQAAARALKQSPDHVTWTLVHALALSALQRASEALPLFERLSRWQPQVPEHFSNLGNCLCELDREAEALVPLQRAFLLGYRADGLFFALARAELANGRPVPALECIEQALLNMPGDAEYVLLKARILRALDEHEEAAALINSLSAPSLSLPQRIEAAEALLNLAQYEDARAAFAAILSEQANDAQALIGLATCHERHNDLSAANATRAEIDEQSIERESVRSALLQLDARLADRAKQTARARELYERVLEAPPRDPALRTNLRFELGKVCASLGDVTAAQQALALAHQERLATVTTAHPALFREDGLLATLDKPVPDFTPMTGVSDQRKDPLFVVGFPRSGTTLLEQILDAHPALASFDEQPFLQRLVSRLSKQAPGYPAALASLSTNARDDLRAQYFADVDRKRPDLKDRRPVDKNPLYLARLPLVSALFPNAQAILTLRHPCDVVLSCYMQNFRAPAFAVCFESLASTARMYDRVFSHYLSFADRLKTPVVRLRYEDLVRDVAGETRKLFAALGLPWDEGVLAHTEHAKRRGVISTPSYTQVVEPVSSRAVGRWHQWEDAFRGEVLDTLSPWIERFGYSSSKSFGYSTSKSFG